MTEKPPGGDTSSDGRLEDRSFLALLRRRFPTSWQFVLFCLVGGSGLVVDYAVLVPLTELAGWDPRAAAVVAFAVAVTWNYWLNRKFTFKAGADVGVSRSYVVFVAICVAGLGVRLFTMHALMEWAGMKTGRWYLLASFLGIVAATVSNFVGSKYLAFRSFRAKGRPKDRRPDLS